MTTRAKSRAQVFGSSPDIATIEVQRTYPFRGTLDPRWHRATDFTPDTGGRGSMPQMFDPKPSISRGRASLADRDERERGRRCQS
jgi:hypothetical protein